MSSCDQLENINHKEKQRGCPLLDANKHTHIYIWYRCNFSIREFLLYQTGYIWSSIVIVHEKFCFFFVSFFQNFSKTVETILIEKIAQNYSV